MNYNPYFPGGAISMPRVIFDGLVEYEDGTPATTAQMAKDVVTFLHWAAEPEHDERKQIGIKAVIIFSSLTLIALYVKRFKWSAIKTRKIGERVPQPSLLSISNASCSLPPAGEGGCEHALDPSIPL